MPINYRCRVMSKLLFQVLLIKSHSGYSGLRRVSINCELTSWFYKFGKWK